MKKFYLLLLVMISTFAYQAEAQVRIMKVDHVNDQITLQNYGAASVNVTAWWICNSFSYAQISGLTIVSGSVFMTPNSQLVISRVLPATPSDVGLYSSASFSSSTAMRDFMQYGAGGQGRESVAVTKGIWTAGEFVGGPGPYVYNGDGLQNGASFWSSPINVTFQVDLALQTVDPLGAYFAGDLQGWSPTPMTLVSGTVYEITYALTPGETVTYKFLNGPGGWENAVPSSCATGGYNNRFFNVPATDTVLPAVCYDACVSCFELTSVMITFRIDMSNEIVSDSGVHIAGNWQGFCADCDEMTPIGNGVYEKTFILADQGNDLLYKYINGNAFDGSEELIDGMDTACAFFDGFNWNRVQQRPTADTTFAEVCFGHCVTCDLVTPPTPLDVTFRVNMSNETVSDSGVHLMGTFNGFNPSSTPMTHAGGGIYTATVTIDSGSYNEYRFINGNDYPFAEVGDSTCGVPDAFGNYNRTHVVTMTETLPIVCFDECTNCVATCGPVVTSTTPIILVDGVRIAWDAPAGATKYIVTGGPSFQNPNNWIKLAKNASPLDALNLSPGITFNYRIIAICGTDTAAPSALFSFTTKTCNAPATISSSNVASTSATLNWSAVPEAKRWEIVGQKSGGAIIVKTVANPAATSFNASGLTPSTTYNWSVKAVCKNDGTIKSPLVSPNNSFTTLAPRFGQNLIENNQIFEIYPNPADKQLYVALGTFDKNDDIEIMVHDLSGKVVHHVIYQDGTSYDVVTINTAQWARGFYTIVTKANNTVESKKLIIAH